MNYQLPSDKIVVAYYFSSLQPHGKTLLHGTYGRGTFMVFREIQCFFRTTYLANIQNS